MANKKINDLTAASNISANMQFETDLSGTTANKVTALQIDSFVMTGKPLGRTFTGGSQASENLTLESTSNATKGLINFGSAATSYFDESSNTFTLSGLTETSILGTNANKTLVSITALPNGTTATTQPSGDNSTKLATTAYVDNSIAKENLWDRNGTVIYPAIPGDNLAIGSGYVHASEFVVPTVIGATYFASFATSINGDFGYGSLVTVATGGAAVVGGYLDLAHNDVRYVDISAPKNADFTQLGTIKWIIKPNYNNAPNTDQYLIDLFESTANDKNRILLYHLASNAALGYSIYNSAGVMIYAASLGDWFPTNGTDYEFELTQDINTGVNELRINGILFGSMAGTGTRTSVVTKLRIGSDRTGTYRSNFKVKNVIVFNSIQHTSNYTPGYTLDTIYTKINNLDGARFVGGLQIYNLAGTKVLDFEESTSLLNIYDSAGNSKIVLNPNGISTITSTTDNLAKLHIGNYVGATSVESYLAVSASVAGEAILATLINSTTTANCPISLTFNSLSNTGVEREFGKISINNTTVTNGAENGEIIVSSMLNGTLTEAFRIDDLGHFCVGTTDGSSAKLVIYSGASTNGLSIKTTAHAGSYSGLIISNDEQDVFSCYDNGLTSFGTATYNVSLSPSAGSFTVKSSQVYSSSVTITAGSYNSLSVTGIRIIYCDTTNGNITIYGFANGVSGQEIVLVKPVTANHVFIENRSAIGTQKITTWNAAEQDLTPYGGCLLVYNGSYWYQINKV
jgi:hypothetical protein